MMSNYFRRNIPGDIKFSLQLKMCFVTAITLIGVGIKHFFLQNTVLPDKKEETIILKLLINIFKKNIFFRGKLVMKQDKQHRNALCFKADIIND